jgi:hypothetical protein
MLSLQCTIGNQAAQRLLEDSPGKVKEESTDTETTRFSHDFSRIPIHAPPTVEIQEKSAINEAGDKYEQEADRVAEQVMRMPVPRLQRIFACLEERPKCQTGQLGGNYNALQTSHIQGNAVGDVVTPSITNQKLHSSSSPLEPADRAFFEPRFGLDLRYVRIHTDAQASEMARSIQARAFTYGRDIYFASTQFNTTSWEGRKLLAHELTHTIQQGFHAGLLLQRFSFGEDGSLSEEHRRAVSTAARIAEQRVLRPDFSGKWNAFWRGPGQSITPKPSLEAYRAAVRNRRFHDMDSSHQSGVRELVESERSMPLERQTAAVTTLGTQDTYLRRFLIDQGTDALVSTILHESLHGAGATMGPFLMFEPAFHMFEADIGFPMMMGGADIASITQRGLGEGLVEIVVSYQLRLIGDDPEVPGELEVKLVNPLTGELLSGPATHGRVSNALGLRQWTGRIRGRQGSVISVRIESHAERILLGARQFVLGSPLRELGREDPCAQMCETRFEQCLRSGSIRSPMQPMYCISHRQTCLLRCAGMSESRAARLARGEDEQ